MSLTTNSRRIDSGVEHVNDQTVADEPQGEALLRRRKARYYEHEPRPGISVIGARLKELTDLR